MQITQNISITSGAKVTQKPSELQQTLQRAEGYIIFLEGSAILLLCFYFIQMLHEIFASSSSTLFEIFGRVGILISVLLASQVARRQLTFSKIVETKKQLESTRTAALHLSTICGELKRRISTIKEDLEESNRSTKFAIENANAISNLASVCHEREIYAAFPTSLLLQIGEIPVDVFAISVFATDLMERKNGGKTEKTKIVEVDAVSKATAHIDQVTNNLKTIIAELKVVVRKLDEDRFD